MENLTKIAEFYLGCDREALTIKERKCAMDLEKIAETQIDKFKAFAGLTVRKITK